MNADSSSSNNFLGLEVWQGLLILIVGALAVIGFCIAFGLVSGMTLIDDNLAIVAIL